LIRFFIVIIILVNFIMVVRDYFATRKKLEMIV